MDVHSLGKSVQCVAIKNSDLYQPGQGSSVLPGRGHNSVIDISNFLSQFHSLIWRSSVQFPRLENFSQNYSQKKGTIPSLTPKSFLLSFLLLNLPSLTQNIFFFFLFLMNLMASCAATHLAFSVHLSYPMHMILSDGWEALARCSHVAFTSTSICNYSCQLCPSCTLIFQFAGQVAVSQMIIS